jgi:hypothetical protein
MVPAVRAAVVVSDDVEVDAVTGEDGDPDALA